MSNRFDRFDLTGKTALVTGAAGLLGVQHASALLECGATVVITDVRDGPLAAARKDLARSFDERCIVTHVMDVTRKESITSVANAVGSAGMRVDILVNNAAIDPKVQG